MVSAIGAAVAFWLVNALVMGPRLAGPGGMRAFLENLALAVTFVTSVPVAVTAFTLVSERGMVPGRDALPGIGRRTVVLPSLAGLAVVGLGAAVSALALIRWSAGGWTAVLKAHGPRLFAAGAGFALMGSLVGNLAGSVTLEARDLGRWVRVNLILAVSLAAFYMLLMFSVLHIMQREIRRLVP